MKQTLRIKTPIYMGNGTWLEEDFTETHSASPIVEVGMKGFGSAISLNNTLLFSLLCAAAFVWLTFGTALLPSANSLAPSLTVSPRARFEWAGNRGRALMSWQQYHLTNIQQ